MRPVRRNALLPGVLIPLVTLPLLAALALPQSVLAAPPATRDRGSLVERYSAYEPQGTCSPQAKPGVVAFMRMTLKAYPGTGSSGIVRACSKGGRSEHKEGRAWDWRVSATAPRQRAQAAEMLGWLFAPDRHGNDRAMARRLGLMYVIWDRRIWSSDRPDSWRRYTGPDPHTNHMHFSFNVLGGQGLTSYWTGTVPPALRPGPVDPVLPVPPAAGPRLPVLDAGLAEVVVPAGGKQVTTEFALRAGRRYRLTVTGTWAYGTGAHTADAECSRWPRDGQWRATTQWEGDDASGALDLRVTGHADLAGSPAHGDWTPVADDGGGCDPDHDYSRIVLATSDSPLQLQLVDDEVSDNSGELVVRVEVLDAATPTD